MQNSQEQSNDDKSLSSQSIKGKAKPKNDLFYKKKRRLFDNADKLAK